MKQLNTTQLNLFDKIVEEVNEHSALEIDVQTLKKNYYSISEVAKMFAVNKSLLRFWETEFSQIEPKKTARGDRFYSPQNVQIIKVIYYLLKEKKLTIEGAKQYFIQGKKKQLNNSEIIDDLQEIRAFFVHLKNSLV